MNEHKLANGTTITEADIDRLCKEFEPRSWVGRLERIHRGLGPITAEPLVTVPVKFPKSMVEAINEQSTNRSDFIRKAVVASL